MNNSIDQDKSYKVSGDKLIKLSEYIDSLYRDIRDWQAYIQDAFTSVSTDPMSAAKFTAKIATIALRIEHDMREGEKSMLRNFPFDLATEPIDETTKGETK